MSLPEQTLSRTRRAFRWLGLGLTLAFVTVPARDSYGEKCKVDDDTEWSEFPPCSRQFAADRRICQGLPENAKDRRQKCWSSQNQRLAACNGSKGLVLNFPDLKTD